MSAEVAPIVCGLDFSPESRRALRLSAQLAARLDRPLHLVSAVEPLILEAARAQRRSPEFLDHVETLLADAGHALALPEGRISVAVESGEPATVLLQAAASCGATHIVVGTRGLGRAARAVLGSTTLRLMRATTLPVLAVPGDAADGSDDRAWPPISRMVCGVDFSDGSMAAAREAAALGDGLGVPVRLVHAVPSMNLPFVWEDFARDAEEARIAEATDRLREVARNCCPGADVLAAVGTPPEVLAAESGDDLSIIVAVGLHGASRHRPGSTALRVLSAARAPVLAVPEPD